MKRRIAVVCIGAMLASSVLAGNVNGKEPGSKGRGASYSDVNGDGICDNRTEFCNDEDHDGWCDEKKGCYVDADEDGVCDHCKQSYADADGDGICDHRKKADKVMHKRGRCDKNEGIRHGGRNCR